MRGVRFGMPSFGVVYEGVTLRKRQGTRKRKKTGKSEFGQPPGFKASRMRKPESIPSNL